MSVSIIPTVVFSPKTFTIPDTLQTEKKALGRIIIAALGKIFLNGVILQPDSNEKPWSYGFKDFDFEERICLEEILKKFLFTKRFIKVSINKKNLNVCQQISRLERIEKLDFCILPLNNICNFPLCCLLINPNLRIDEFFSKESSRIFEPFFTNRDFDICHQFGNIDILRDLFFNRLFHFTKDIEIIDRYAGQNLINATSQDTQYCTLSWMYEIFITENIKQGNFIIHTTTGNPSQTINDIENNANQWIAQQNVSEDHKIIIKIYPYRNRFNLIFPHYRAIHTDQFSFRFDSGFTFITDNSGVLRLKDQPNFVTFFSEWKIAVNMLRNLSVIPSIIST